MKNFLLHIALLFCVIFVNSLQVRADIFSYLRVTVNGEQISYSLNDIKKITFDAENMFLNMADEEVAVLPFTTLTKMTFSDPTGLTVVDGGRNKLEINGGTLNVDMQSEGIVVLYDASGKTVQSAKVKSGKNAIDLGSLQKGVYIIKVNGDTQKIMNK